MSTFGVIVTNRSFFPDHLVVTGRETLLRKLGEWGHRAIALSTDDTYLGQVVTYDEAAKCARLFRAHCDEIEGIIVCLPNFGEEAGVADALRMAGLNVPVLVQACDDELDKLQLVNRRDAFCGKLSLCNNLYQNDIPFTNTSRHTCALDSDSFKADVERFSVLCRVVRRLRSARLGVLGARPDPFRTVRYSEKLLQRLGITTAVSDFSEIIAAARQVDEARIADQLDAIRAYAAIEPGVSADKLRLQAAMTLAVADWTRAHHCDAIAMQCWDTIEQNFGCAACLSMSMLSSAGIPAACETDVMGALSMLALLTASGNPPVYEDWNNNYGDCPDRCINVHCSNYPTCAFAEPPVIGHLDILATTLGKDVSFGALKGRVRAGDMTYLKLTTDDKHGKVKCYLGEGEFVDAPLDTFGGVAVCQVRDLNGLMNHLVNNGYEHHVAITHGRCADVLEEALTKYLGIEVYRHS